MHTWDRWGIYDTPWVLRCVGMALLQEGGERFGGWEAIVYRRSTITSAGTVGVSLTRFGDADVIARREHAVTTVGVVP